jgi:NADH-quinone oxidoreductase subunit G
MPTLEIDGQSVTVGADLNLIEAANRIGLEIPHYCYHPGLSIAGNCRICLVEIERMPKLQIACNTRVLDGMVVHTQSPKVAAARQAVLEFLLLNHPIDCPVCDQAGECKLQDYYMEYGRYVSRMPLERKVRKGKVIDLGPDVLLDQERCILCTRCTRFLDEVTHTSELGVFERGDHCVIDVFPGRRVDNPYATNIVDVCPVGALTSKDFRFRSRVWYLDRAESICTACSRGCNVDVYHRRGEVFRYRPRYNPDVNKWWLCDAGRRSYASLAGERRLTQALVRGEQGFSAVEWSIAAADAVERLRTIVAARGKGSIAGVVSAQASNEEAYLFKRFLREGLGTERIHGFVWSPADATADDFLICGDKNPNARGLELLGVPRAPDGLEELLTALESGEIAGIVLLRSDLAGCVGEARVAAALEAAGAVVVIDSYTSATAAYADVVLPVGAHVEAEGTFTNVAGRVQRVRQAFPPPGEARAGWMALADLGRQCGIEREYASAAAVFDEIGGSGGAFAGLSFEGLGPHGRQVPCAVAAAANSRLDDESGGTTAAAGSV